MHTDEKREVITFHFLSAITTCLTFSANLPNFITLKKVFLQHHDKTRTLQIQAGFRLDVC